MLVQIDMPESQSLLVQTVNVPIAAKGATWSQSILGDIGRERGVYIIHQGKEVLYVGETGGDSMSFGIRLRREFQESASGGRHIFPKLAALPTEPQIQVSLIPASQIREWFSADVALTDSHRQNIVEQILIGSLQPRFQTVASGPDD